MANAPRRPPLDPRPCAQCRTIFTPLKPRKGQPEGVVCGRTLCWALQYNTQEEWDGARRMAAAKYLALTGADDPARYWTDHLDRGHWLLPGWTALDDEAMRRGRGPRGVGAHG